MGADREPVLVDSQEIHFNEGCGAPSFYWKGLGKAFARDITYEG